MALADGNKMRKERILALLLHLQPVFFQTWQQQPSSTSCLARDAWGRRRRQAAEEVYGLNSVSPLSDMMTTSESSHMPDALRAIVTFCTASSTTVAMA